LGGMPGEPVGKPGPGARRGIFSHGKAQRWRRSGPSTKEQRSRGEKGPPPRGDSFKNARRSRISRDKTSQLR
jgi:hypothetical protein